MTETHEPVFERPVGALRIFIDRECRDQQNPLDRFILLTLFVHVSHGMQKEEWPHA